MDKSNQIKKLYWNARSFAMQGMNNEERDFFERLTQSLQERQDDFFQYLKERTLETYHHSEQINAIHTWMQRDGNEPMTDFFPMLDDTELPTNLVFVDCPCSEISNYEEHIHKVLIDGIEKEVSLVHTDVFLEKEKIVFALFQAYNVFMPRIYNPYARRAFLVVEDFEPISEKDDEAVLNEKTEFVLNFKRQKIEFQDKHIFHGNLYWNLELIPSSKLARYNEVPVAGKQFVRIRFENIKKNSFIVIDGLDVENCPMKRNGETIDVEQSDFEASYLQYQMVTVKEIHTSQKTFCNTVRNDSPIPDRIRTKADIRLAVHAYALLPEEFVGFFSKTNQNTLKGYPRHYKYPYSGALDVGRTSKNYCYLKFQQKKDDIFFEDRVEYLISFLRYQYPECYWVGEQ